MTGLNNLSANKKKFIKDIIYHACLMWASLSLAYNSYKKYVRGPGSNVFPPELKAAIKSDFAWAFLIFILLFFLLETFLSRKDIYPTFKQYLLLAVLYFIFVNIFLYSEKIGVLVVLNLSSIYLILILLALFLMEKIPPEVKKYYMVRPDVIWNELGKFVRRPYTFFYSGFLILLMLHTFLMIYGHMFVEPPLRHKISAAVLNVAYFMLIAGVGVEIYAIVKHRERNEGYFDSNGC